jgi:hypothetical protein
MTKRSEFKKQIKNIQKTFTDASDEQIETTATHLIGVVDKYVAESAQKNFDNGFTAGNHHGQQSALAAFAAVLKSNGGTLTVTAEDTEEIGKAQHEVNAVRNKDGTMTYTLKVAVAEESK